MRLRRGDFHPCFDAFSPGQFEAALSEADFSHKRIRFQPGPFIQHPGLQSVDRLPGTEGLVSEGLEEVIHGRCP